MQAQLPGELIKNIELSHFTLENLHEGVFWVNSGGQIIQVNKMATIMTGRSAEELTSMKVPELNPTMQDFASFWKKLKKAKKLTFESKHIHKDGHVYDVEITGNFIEFEGQEFTCSIVRYVNNEKKENELYRYTLENLHEDIYWIDDKANIIQVNESACKTIGFTKEELLKKTVYDINPTENAKTWANHWKQVKKEKKITLQTIHKHKQGYDYEVEITNNYIEFGGKEYACSVVRDLRKKRMEEEILKMISEATAGLTGEDYFKELAKHVTAALGVRYALVTECANDEKTRVRTLSYVDRQDLIENVE